MSQPRLLDLFCKAGGAAEGYHRAGFEVIGVDIEPQPHYRFEFIRADALTFPILGFDAVHASPPCQHASSLNRGNHKNTHTHPALIEPIRERLVRKGIPYVIENVPGAALRLPVTLCGTMFGLGFEEAQLRRHRLFEANFPLQAPGPCAHFSHAVGVYGHTGGHSERARTIGVYGGGGRDNRRSAAASPKMYPVAARRIAMDIDWMTNDELTQAIPPAYTEWIGQRLIAHLKLAI